MQQLADAELAARPGAVAKGRAPAAAALPQKEAPLLFDLVYAGDAGLCIKASGWDVQSRAGGLKVGWRWPGSQSSREAARCTCLACCGSTCVPSAGCGLSAGQARHAEPHRADRGAAHWFLEDNQQHHAGCSARASRCAGIMPGSSYPGAGHLLHDSVLPGH